ncbi:MAG: hypothetical protein KDE20_22070 [Caldilineaceae bacterium]|nr:hypothetical protein [Caldilineaceae bacterium]
MTQMTPLQKGLGRQNHRDSMAQSRRFPPRFRADVPKAMRNTSHLSHGFLITTLFAAESQIKRQQHGFNIFNQQLSGLRDEFESSVPICVNLWHIEVDSDNERFSL